MRSNQRAAYIKSKGKTPKMKENPLKGFKPGEKLSAIKNEANKFVPILSLTLLQILVSVQAYMYHTGMSLFQLIWVMCSFIVPVDIGLYLGIIFLLPVYLGQFVVIFGLRIPIV